MSPASAVAAPLYGGPRLQPAHFEPAYVPEDVARFGDEPHTLPVGSPGKVGILELDFALRGVEPDRRTEVVHHYQKTPLLVFRPLYLDLARPDMPYVYVLSTGGGILHNDRQRTDLRFGPGAAAHITTQAHTKVYRMESGYAAAQTNLTIAGGAFVEYLPDPLIPFSDARFYQRMSVELDESATLVLGETVYAGRLTRGERHAYSAYASDVDVRRPNGDPVVFDRVRLVPRDGRVGGDAVLGGRDIVTSLYALTPRCAAAELAQALHDAVAPIVSASADRSARFGVSILPGSAGAWLRFVGDDTVTSLAVSHAAAAAVHQLLLGTPAPTSRKP